jgi:hypothetical protein
VIFIGLLFALSSYHFGTRFLVRKWEERAPLSRSFGDQHMTSRVPIPPTLENANQISFNGMSYDVDVEDGKGLGSTLD